MQGGRGAKERVQNRKVRRAATVGLSEFVRRVHFPQARRAKLTAVQSDLLKSEASALAILPSERAYTMPYEFLKAAREEAVMPDETEVHS